MTKFRTSSSLAVGTLPLRFSEVRGLSCITTFSIFAVLAAGVTACSSQADEAEAVEQSSAPIVGGAPDTKHAAVVSIYAEQGQSAMLCSGTIVGVDGVNHLGYVLTAGHCLAFPPKYVYLGDDFIAHTSTRLQVLDYQKHPNYDGAITSSYDFGLIRVAGIAENAPKMPVLSPSQDALAPDSVVTCVGFGRTSAPPATNQNTVRQSIDRTLSNASTTKLSYSLATGGICNGDSGGPAIVTVGATEYVAGVHSYVTGNCDGTGVSGRISVAADWVASVVSQPPPAPKCGYAWTGGACAYCTDAGCCDEVAACGADGACRACLDQGDKAPGCGTNPHRLALAQCRERTCATTCGTEDSAWSTTTSSNVDTLNGLPSDAASGGCAIMPAPSPSTRTTRSVWIFGALAAMGMLLRRRRGVR